tara:strand:+ start:205 stop:495 length:291 start_codon:yes stop_codon:yes gene_type:complete
MYGTIFNLKVKDGHEKLLLEEMNTQEENPEGMIAWFLMTPDDTSKDWIGVAVFNSKEDHVNNANRPQQAQSFQKMMEHLEEEPKWTDGEYPISEII